jgi:hypothetical protein
VPALLAGVALGVPLGTLALRGGALLGTGLALLLEQRA